MSSEIKLKPDTSMEPFFDISRRWRRPFQLVLTLMSIALLYIVTISKYEEPLHEKQNGEPISLRVVGSRENPIQMPREAKIEELSVKEEPFKMPDVDNTQVIVPTGPIGDPTQCPKMLEDVDVAPQGSMPLTALASFPRSGNTWTRLLLQVASKISTGSVYWETEQKYEWNKKTFKAGTEDFRHRTGVCVKTHYYSKEHIEMFPDGAILLLRNPYFSLVSEFFRELTFDGNRTNEETARAILQEPRWRTGYFPNQSGFWKNTNLNWIKYCKRLLVVFYEDLEKNPVYELSRMLQFLKQPLRLDRLKCALQLFPPDLNHTYLNFDPYTPEQHAHLDRYIAEVNEVLVARNGRPLPKYKYSFQ
ncbi:WSC domain-containing protein 1 [Holothuria leucospilota]|uniref:WSC domain-containing protein 1 n=1 Tax=Holothuria leucospilota TaxID=206669 RepID=A0A9Q0YJ65_HOLLE|nr:WSC domain-containing protein 1 [Holothuria leucospilota]